MEKKVLDWLEQAQADLKTAKDLLNSKDYYASVNYSQQSAEKGLKAIYILHKKKLPPKIHDLVELGRQVGAPSEVINQAEKLTPTFLTVRYPDAAPLIPVKFYNEEKAKNHLQEAEVILQWAIKTIK